MSGSEVDLEFGKDPGEARRNAADERAAAGIALGASADDYVRTKATFDSMERCLR